MPALAPGGITRGKNYYSDLGRSYSNEETPAKFSKVVDMDESDDEDLKEVLFQASKLPLWFARGLVANQKNGPALMHGVLEFVSYLGRGKNDLLMKALRWVSAAGFDQRFPDIGCHAKSHLDKVLDKSWAVMQGQGVGANTSWQSVRSFAGVVLDVGAWGAGVHSEKGCATVRPQLMVFSGSIVGQRVFAKALRDISYSSTGEVIVKSVEVLLESKEKFTKQVLKRHRSSLETTLKRQGISLHLVVKPRRVSLIYKGVEFQAQVCSFPDEYELKGVPAELAYAGEVDNEVLWRSARPAARRSRAFRMSTTQEGTRCATRSLSSTRSWWLETDSR